MKISAAFPSDYLKADTDIGANGPDLVLQITKIDMADLGQGEQKPCVHFANHQKGLLLNKTNANTIADIYGDDTDQWLGQTITIGAQWVEFQGRQTLGLRVRPVFPNQPQQMAQQAQAPVQQPVTPPPPQQPVHQPQYQHQNPIPSGPAPQQGVADDDPMSDPIPF